MERRQICMAPNCVCKFYKAIDTDLKFVFREHDYLHLAIAIKEVSGTSDEIGLEIVAGAPSVKDVSSFKS